MKNEFVNPYNFIPLGKEKTTYQHPETKEELFTGEISYSVLTKTPLFIPDTNNVKISKVFSEDGTEGEHKIYKFFSYGDGIPVIPGSEMRGMLRTNFEVLTNSCLSALDSDIQLSKRTSEVFKPGLLKKENGKFFLCEAFSIQCRMNEVQELKETQKVGYELSKQKKDNNDDKKIRFIATKVTPQWKKSSKNGYLLKGENGGKKTSYHILYQKDKESKVLTEAITLDILDKVLEIYQKNNKYAYKEYTEALEKFKNSNSEEYFPVYYSKLKKNIGHCDKKEEQLFLSPACITREIYTNTLRKCADTYMPCETKEQSCPTCALFGMLGADGDGITSRLRFSDLICENKDKVDVSNPVILKELSSPKLNNMEFYLERPKNAVFWTYDYYIDKRGNVISYTPKLNGRKFYWHHHMKIQNYRSIEKNNRNVTVYPVKENVIFQGKVFFRDISERELKQLIWLLNVGEYTEISKKKKGYKLGLAKPLGFGSIAINVDKVKIRKINLEENKVKIVYEDYQKVGYTYQEVCFDKFVEMFFSKASSFEAVGEKQVCYPFVNKDEKKEQGYQWFVDNHKVYRKKKNEITDVSNNRTEMVFINYLQSMELEIKEVDEVFTEKFKEYKKKKKK